MFLQRLVAEHCFIGGAPYGHAWPVDSLAAQVRCSTDAWPEPHFVFQGQDATARGREFVANLHPPPDRLLAAHLSFFDALLAQPAPTAGSRCWGLKKVRLSADHAAYLK